MPPYVHIHVSNQHCPVWMAAAWWSVTCYSVGWQKEPLGAGQVAEVFHHQDSAAGTEEVWAQYIILYIVYDRTQNRERVLNGQYYGLYVYTVNVLCVYHVWYQQYVVNIVCGSQTTCISTWLLEPWALGEARSWQSVSQGHCRRLHQSSLPSLVQ